MESTIAETQKKRGTVRSQALLTLRVLPISLLMLSGCGNILMRSEFLRRTTIPAPPELSTPTESAPLKLCPVPTASTKGTDTVLAVSAATSSGVAIRGLQPRDFAVYSGRQLLKIDRLTDSADQPISIVVVVDASMSMKLKLETIQKGLDDFLKSLSACDEVALVAFGGTGAPDDATVTVIQPFTTDKALASTRLQNLEGWARPPLYDATSQGLSLLANAHYPNRVLLVLGDGMESGSKIEKDQILHDLRKGGLLFYSVGIGDPNASSSPSMFVGKRAIVHGGGIDRLNADTLKEMATAADGYAFLVPLANQDGGKAFSEAMTTIAGSIASGYVLEVAVAKSVASPTAEQLSVSVRSHPDATVHVRVIADHRS